VTFLRKHCISKFQVDRQNRFRGPVLGPIGSFVKIAAGKDQFASVAEFALGNGTLDRFIVTNDHDRKLLQGIRNRAGCRQDCGILQIHEHAKYEIPSPPVEGIETVASVLQIANDLVFNCLVDHCKIEEKALSTSKNESEDLLLMRGNDGKHSIRGKIKNVYFLPQGDNWTMKNGTIGLSSNEKRLKKTIGVDKSAALAENRHEAQVLKEEMDALGREENRLEHEHTKQQKVWNVKKKELRKNQVVIDGYLATIEAIKEEEVTAANFDTDTSEYERAIQEEQQFVESLKEQESSIESQIEEKRPEVDDLKRRINEVDIRNEKVLRDIATAEQDLADFVQNLTQRQEKLEKKREKIRQFEAIIEKRDDEIQDIKATIGEYLQTAKKLAAQRLALEKEQAENFDSKSQKLTEEDLEAIEIPQLDSIKPPKHFETRVQRMKSKIQEEEERRSASEVDPLEVQEKYERAKQVLESKMQQIREIDETCKDLKDDHTARKQRWKQFREHIGFSTDRGFDEILNKKGSAGTIEFDHKNKNLNLCVQKDSADTNSQQKDVKALSGGERSFTTIALLLALGESLETPFRVLDEFDVFLDPGQ
jgi:chromosome segregation ATPase